MAESGRHVMPAKAGIHAFSSGAKACGARFMAMRPVAR
jgi:hypothetical protein